MASPRRIFISVAEQSGDTHAGNFVNALRAYDPLVHVDAIGGRHLREAGAVVHHDTVSRSAMGLRAYLRYFEVKRLLAWTDRFYREHKPDLHVCCDSWTMNYHFAKLAKKHGVKVLYYIAPQAWASREGRVAKLAQVADRVACILPFEEKFFRDRGANASYVGHPLFDEITLPIAPPQKNLRGPVIALPCGSRAGVAKKNFPRLLEVADRIRQAFPTAAFRVPTTAQTHGVVSELTRNRDDILVMQDAFDELLPGCDLAVTVSGTATLHIAAHRVPMIVVYAGNKLLWHVVGTRLIKIRTFAQVNLLALDGRDAPPSEHVVPEFIPWFGPVDAVADRAIAMLRDPAQIEAQRAKLDALIAKVGKPGASMNVAKMAMELMEQS
jgi:lipid-A-disaccharide synthase